MKHELFTIQQNERGLCLILTSGWSDVIGSYMIQHDINQLWVNYTQGFSGSNVEFLKELSFLKELHIVVYNPSGLNSIEKIHSLEVFINGCRDRTSIDFSMLPHLKVCGISWHSGISTLLKCPSLVSLNLSNYAYPSADGFCELNSLENLTLNGGKISSIDDFSLPSLTELSLINLPGLSSIKGIEVLSKLQKLCIDTCKSINEISPVSNLSSLKWFDLSNCKYQIGNSLYLEMAGFQRRPF